MERQAYYIKLGKQIKALRERRGLEQKEIADLMGVGTSLVSQWERGATRIQVQQLFQLLNELGVSGQVERGELRVFEEC